jgi:hypothetical protein
VALAREDRDLIADLVRKTSMNTSLAEGGPSRWSLFLSPVFDALS